MPNKIDYDPWLSSPLASMSTYDRAVQLYQSGHLSEAKQLFNESKDHDSEHWVSSMLFLVKIEKIAGNQQSVTDLLRQVSDYYQHDFCEFR
jgi:hypothetical protein